MSKDKKLLLQEFACSLAVQTVLGLEKQGVLKFKSKLVAGGVATPYHQRSRAMYVLYKVIIIAITSDDGMIDESIKNAQNDLSKYLEGLDECEKLDPQAKSLIDSLLDKYLDRLI